MSNALAIAAVTTTLRNLIDKGFRDDLTLPGGIPITALPPDKARGTIEGNQVNLFLYQTTVNAAWRNMDIPNQVRQGESGMPPLALNLYYLVTAYSQETPDDNAIISHHLLGRAMGVLHDHPLLGTVEIEQALVGSGLGNQIERVRITPQPMSLEEISKLWMVFQTQYRISAAYEVAVVLIDSRLPVRTPLPVLRRGRDGKGPTVLADIIPFPTLFSLRLKQQPLQPPMQPGPVAVPNITITPAARLKDTLVIGGHHLDGVTGQNASTPFVRFTNQRLGFTREISPDAGATADEIQVTLPDNDHVNLKNPSNFAAGFYTLAVVFRESNAGVADPQGIVVGETNELALSLVPQIININPTTAPRGDVIFTITCNPAVQPGQRVSLLFSDQEILFAPEPPITSPVEQLTFVVKAAAPGIYYLRLRMDGIDSLLVDPAVDPITTPPVFDPNMQVTIT